MLLAAASFTTMLQLCADATGAAGTKNMQAMKGRINRLALIAAQHVLWKFIMFNNSGYCTAYDRNAAVPPAPTSLLAPADRNSPSLKFVARIAFGIWGCFSNGYATVEKLAPRGSTPAKQGHRGKTWPARPHFCRGLRALRPPQARAGSGIAAALPEPVARTTFEA